MAIHHILDDKIVKITWMPVLGSTNAVDFMIVSKGDVKFFQQAE
jgi:hypothetical protein